MRASGIERRCLPLAVLLLVLCSLQYAAAARSSSGRSLKQSQPTAGVVPMAKKPKPLTQTEIMTMAAATGALLPVCVPKYVSELVIPPPMPVTTQPLTEVSHPKTRCCLGPYFYPE